MGSAHLGSGGTARGVGYETGAPDAPASIRLADNQIIGRRTTTTFSAYARNVRLSGVEQLQRPALRGQHCGLGAPWRLPSPEQCGQVFAVR
jgi:hypothetical protein